MANYLTFGEIIEAVEIAVKQYQSSMQPLVKSTINQVYLNEVLQADKLYPLHWLYAPITHKFHAPKTITGITQAAAGVVTSVAHGFIGGEIIAIWNVSGMTEINYDYVGYLGNIRLYYVVRINADTFSLKDLWGNAIATTTFTAYTSGGTILHHGWAITGTLSDVIRSVKEVSIHDGENLTPISWAELLESPDTYISVSSTTPERFLHLQNFSTTGTSVNMAITFPGSQENKIAYLMIEATGERLSADADVPLLPPQFHDALISGSITRLAENQVQVENQVIWPSLYKTHLDAIVYYNREWWEQHRVAGKPYLL